MSRFLLVFVGGGLGAMVRYGATLISARATSSLFPWGTLISNLSGCFLIGIIFALAERSQLVGPSARLFLMAGFLGGLTTFSAYGLEGVMAARAGNYALLLAQVAANNVAGLLLVVLGMLSVTGLERLLRYWGV